MPLRFCSLSVRGQLSSQRCLLSSNRSISISTTTCRSHNSSIPHNLQYLSAFTSFSSHPQLGLRVLLDQHSSDRNGLRANSTMLQLVGCIYLRRSKSRTEQMSPIQSLVDHANLSQRFTLRRTCKFYLYQYFNYFNRKHIIVTVYLKSVLK